MISPRLAERMLGVARCALAGSEGVCQNRRRRLINAPARVAPRLAETLDGVESTHSRRGLDFAELLTASVSLS